MTKVSLLKKSTIVLMIATVFACTLAAQEYDRAIIITGGYVPSQELSVNKNTTAITFELYNRKITLYIFCESNRTKKYKLLDIDV